MHTQCTCTAKFCPANCCVPMHTSVSNCSDRLLVSCKAPNARHPCSPAQDVDCASEAPGACGLEARTPMLLLPAPPSSCLLYRQTCSDSHRKNVTNFIKCSSHQSHLTYLAWWDQHIWLCNISAKLCAAVTLEGPQLALMRSRSWNCAPQLVCSGPHDGRHLQVVRQLPEASTRSDGQHPQNSSTLRHRAVLPAPWPHQTRVGSRVSSMAKNG